MGTISTTFALKRYHLMLELLHWLGYNPQKILYGIDGVQKGLNTVNQIG